MACEKALNLEKQASSHFTETYVPLETISADAKFHVATLVIFIIVSALTEFSLTRVVLGAAAVDKNFLLMQSQIANQI